MNTALEIRSEVHIDIDGAIETMYVETTYDTHAHAYATVIRDWHLEPCCDTFYTHTLKHAKLAHRRVYEHADVLVFDINGSFTP